ncbi:hypothetical protein ACN47E_006087 [Coniothyrium glycines]
MTFADQASADIARTWPVGTLLFTLQDGCNTRGQRGIYTLNSVPSKRSLSKRQISITLSFAVTVTNPADAIALLQAIYGLLAALQTPSAVPVSSAAVVSTPSLVQDSTPTPASSTPAAGPSSPSSVAQNPPASVPSASCSTESGIYPPAGSSCFNIIGHGVDYIEGLYLRAYFLTNPTFEGSGPVQAVFWTDSENHVYESSRGYVMANDREPTGNWMTFTRPAEAAGMPKATCVKDASTKSLVCFQTTTNVLSVGTGYTDGRKYITMFGTPFSFFTPITLTYEDTACPRLCGAESAPVPVPSPSSSLAVPASSSTPVALPPASCFARGTIAQTPTGSRCFTLTGHGVPHIEGYLLGAQEGDASVVFSNYQGFTPAIFYMQPNGWVGIASNVRSGTIMAASTEVIRTPWLEFADPWSISNGYKPATCSMNSDGTFTCTLTNNWGTNTVWSLDAHFQDKDARDYMPAWGFPNDKFNRLTFTYNEMACPVVCGATPTPTPTPSPSAVTPIRTPTPTPSSVPWCGGLTTGPYELTANGQQSSWDVRCQRQDFPAPQSIYEGYYMATFTGCMEACLSRGELCVAIHYTFVNPWGNWCMLFRSVLPSVDAGDNTGDFNLAFVVARPPPQVVSSDAAAAATPAVASTPRPPVTRSRTVAPSSSTPAPVASSAPWCGGLTGGSYTLGGGSSWNVLCDAQFSRGGDGLDSGIYSTINDCMQHCLDLPRCAVVQFYENVRSAGSLDGTGSGYQCDTFSSAWPSEPWVAPQVDLAFLQRRAPATPVNTPSAVIESSAPAVVESSAPDAAPTSTPPSMPLSSSSPRSIPAAPESTTPAAVQPVSSASPTPTPTPSTGFLTIVSSPEDVPASRTSSTNPDEPQPTFYPCSSFHTGQQDFFGRTWDVYCGKQAPSTEGYYRISYDYGGLEQCMVRCVQDARCTAVQFKEFAPLAEGWECRMFEALAVPAADAPQLEPWQYDTAYILSR